MKKLISCEFNIDTACVELKYSNGSMISINCTAVEYEVANSRFQRSELNWLIYEASTKNLYAAYKRWCEDNAENPLSPKSFANQLSQNAERYHLEPVSNLHIGGGKRCRGYMGIYVLLSPMEL